MGLIKRPGRKNWYARYKGPDGKFLTRSTYTTDRDKAESRFLRWSTQALDEREFGVVPIEEVTLLAFREEYLDERRQIVDPKTVAIDQHVLETFTNLVGMIVPVKSLTTKHVRKFLQHYRQEALAPHTINKYLTHLSTALTWAVENHLLKENPAQKINRPELPDKKPRAIPTADMNMLLEQSYGTWIGDYIRSAEITGIREEDIDWGDEQVRVTGKRSKIRHVPFTPALKALFWEILNRSPAEDVRVLTNGHDGRKAGYLFYQVHAEQAVAHAFKRMVHQCWGTRYYTLISGEYTRDDGTVFMAGEECVLTPQELEDLRGRYKVIRVEVEPEKAPYHFHMLRHTFATAYLRNGGNIYKLKKILGHEEISTTEQYLHLIPQDLRMDTNPFSYRVQRG